MARAGAEVVVIVTGLRIASEMTLGTLTFFVMVGMWNWWSTGVFNLFSDTAPLLEQLVFCVMTFGGLFAFVRLMAWQRIELHADTQTLRVASINTGYRWRTLNAKDISRIAYYNSSKSLGQIFLSGSAEMRVLAILEDSMFAIGPSRFFKKIAEFVREHNPNADISAELTASSA